MPSQVFFGQSGRRASAGGMGRNQVEHRQTSSQRMQMVWAELGIRRVGRRVDSTKKVSHADTPARGVQASKGCGWAGVGWGGKARRKEKKGGQALEVPGRLHTCGGRAGRGAGGRCGL